MAERLSKSNTEVVGIGSERRTGGLAPDRIFVELRYSIWTLTFPIEMGGRFIQKAMLSRAIWHRGVVIHIVATVFVNRRLEIATARLDSFQLFSFFFFPRLNTKLRLG